MRFASYEINGSKGVALVSGQDWRGLDASQGGYPGDLLQLIREGWQSLEGAAKILSSAPVLSESDITLLPPVSDPEKIICIGLNYLDHSNESGIEQPKYPTVFSRFNSSLIAHGGAIVRPQVSEQLDFEGELVAIIGKECRNVSREDGLDCVMGYSLFNDASIRDYQFISPQWTPGKNFDATGAFGPIVVTADELPAACDGLTLVTRLNGEVVQKAPIRDMVFPIAELVSFLSSFMTLKPGDLIVSGTPSGVGLGREPKLWMRDGDVCEVEIEGIGCLSNPVKDQVLESRKKIAS